MYLFAKHSRERVQKQNLNMFYILRSEIYVRIARARVCVVL